MVPGRGVSRLVAGLLTPRPTEAGPARRLEARWRSHLDERRLSGVTMTPREDRNRRLLRARDAMDRDYASELCFEGTFLTDM